MQAAAREPRVVERISLEEMRSRILTPHDAAAREQGAAQHKISAIPAYRRTTGADDGQDRQRPISAIPSGEPTGGRIIGVYTAQEYAQRVREREAARRNPAPLGSASAQRAAAPPANPAQSGTSTSSGSVAPTSSERALDVDLRAAATTRPEGAEGSPSAGLSAGGGTKVSAYRNLDAVIEGIRKELELNRAEETLTLQVRAQLEQKRGGFGGEESAPAKPPKLDVLGLKNASLLSQMRAATASPSNASTVIHSSSASTSQESPARQGEHSMGSSLGDPMTGTATATGKSETRELPGGISVVAQASAVTRHAAPASAIHNGDAADDTPSLAR